MRRMIPLLLTLLVVSPLFAQAVSHSGQTWELDNKCLKVSLDAQTGNWQVLDKRAGYTWRSPSPASTVNPILLVPQATTPPRVDADLGDWVDKGALINITPQMVGDAKQVDGPADCSARARVLWDPTGLYLAVDVKDQKVVTPAADDSRWWERDSVEFWLEGTQYAFRFGPWGAHVWSQSGLVAEARVAWKPTAGGYQVEASLPAAVVGATKLGGRVRFALGVNDSDGNGRECQLYYPAGWVHSNPETFAQLNLADAAGAPAPERQELRPAFEPVVAGKPGQMSFKTMTRGGKPFEVTVTFALLGNGPDLQIIVDNPNKEMAVNRFSALAPLALDRPGRILASVYNDGIGVRTDDMSYRGRGWSSWGSLDMPWVGVTDGKLGYMLLFELPTTCDNGMATLEAVKVGDQTVLAPTAYHEPTCKQFGAPRVVRYSFCQSGGHVEICKRFREYIKGQGMLVTQREKLRRKPALARLLGAPDIWGRADLKFATEAKAAGMDRLLVNSPQSAADMEKIKSLGYLMGVYDNYEDAFEGDSGRYGDFVEERDVVILADGSRMKAWLTKGEKPKQYMKRCASLFEEVARRWIPLELAKSPYNARFIDVTTATGLQECYHERHPHDRTKDREVKRNLARYVGDELNLVLGGEHGRWWGADLYNYWEGMQSGGFYSWPAGHVGLEMPQKREDIGKNYLEWGLGETNRYPLWELVYHDCVVSTWYWGDSTGHLIATAPELGYKQDAFNVLYGTVPLYWVAQPYSYNWSKPELRERLLESYRNTCKLHEQIGFDEMVSHEFVTDDRHVQHTVFADGTNVWVNFGAEPWKLSYEGKQWTLPQYGFYAKGPKVEQYRVLQPLGKAPAPTLNPALRGEMAAPPEGMREATVIRAPGYLYADVSVPGLLESSGGGQTCRVEGPGMIRVNVAPGTQWVKLNCAALCPASKGAWRLLELDADGQPAALGAMTSAQGNMVCLEPGKAQAVILVGAEALADHAELAAGKPAVTPTHIGQGQPLMVTARVTNLGGQPAKAVPVALMLGPDAVAQTKRDLAAGKTVAAKLKLATTRYDGALPLSVKVAEGKRELCRADNIASIEAYVEPDLRLWDTHFEAKVTAPAGGRAAVVRLPLSAADAAGKDLAATRVVLLQGDIHSYAPAQVLPTEKGAELIWRAPAGQSAYAVYMDSDQAKRHAALPSGRWDAADTTYRGDDYSVTFREGYIKGVYGGEPWQKLISNLSVSSKDTGWFDENGEVQSFEVVSDGPACTQIRVKKKLAGGHFYDKLYTLFPDHFLVSTLAHDRFGNLSRMHVVPDGTYLDDKGLTAAVDGKGDAEGIAGKNAKPVWYVIHGKGYAIVNAAVTPYQYMTYWDGGNKAAVGFEGPTQTPATVAYYMHGPEMATIPSVRDLAQADYAHATAKVEVTR
ncbi:MAG: glycoside hydrolase [Armatimonadia bacterium]